MKGIEQEIFFDFNTNSSSESEEETSDMFDSDVYPLRGEDFNELEEQLNKFKNIKK